MMGPLVLLQAPTLTLSKPEEWTGASTREIREHKRSCECDKDFIVVHNLPCKCSCSAVSRGPKRPRALMFAEELVHDLFDLSQMGSKTVRWDWIWLS